MGSDGTLGLKAIKENFGMAMVQDPASAKYDGMPRSAINTGLVDYVAAAEELPAKLIQYVTHAPAATRGTRSGRGGAVTACSQKVFVLLRAHTGNDFSCYKNNTIDRRIERRMSVHQFDSLPRYVRFLQENPQEVELLYKELLIGVTNFFRDPGLFDFLKEKAIPQLLQARPQGGPLRVWNPGLLHRRGNLLSGHRAQGVLWRSLNAPGRSPPIQIFATDIDKDAIDKARQGTFSASIAADVSPERLARFFRPRRRGLPDQERDPRPGGLRAAEHPRRSAVYEAGHPLLPEPLDLRQCRDAEEAPAADALRLEPRRPVDPGHGREHRRLRPPVLAPGQEVEGLPAHGSAASGRASKCPPSQLPRERAVDTRNRESQRTGHGHFLRGPAGAVGLLRPSLRGGQCRGRHHLRQRATPGKYLEPSSGKVNINVFAMAREGLREELGVAIHNAAKRKTDRHRQAA